MLCPNWRFRPLNVAGQYAGLEQALAQNLTRSIGVSNFDAAQLAVLAKTATITPAVNQCGNLDIVLDLAM